MTQFIATETINVRSEPRIAKNIVGRVRKGAAVIVPDGVPTVEQDGQTWVRIGEFRWVAGRYLTAANVRPIPVRTGSVFGFHLLNNANTTAVYGVIERLAKANKPLRVVVNASFGEFENRKIRALSPKTLILDRSRYTGRDYSTDWDNRASCYVQGRRLAQEHFESMSPDAALATWHQIMDVNEPGWGAGTPDFWQGALDWAEGAGRKLAVGTFAVGTPPLPNEGAVHAEIWSRFYPVLRRVRDRGHVYMLHQYRKDASWSDTWLILRHQTWLNQVPADLRGLPILFGEFGDERAAQDGDFVDDLRKVEFAMANDNIVGAALWTIGNGFGWANDNIEPILGKLEDYLARR